MNNYNIIMKTASLTISSPSNSIPDEIIVFEILKRLPVKTLCRFRAVSKRWLSIINSRSFIDSHFQHSNLNPTCLLGFYNRDTTTTQQPPTFFSPNYPDQLIKWPTNNYRWCSISPRGLICYFNTDSNDDDDTSIEIWNPSTGEGIEVIPPPRKLRKTCPLFLGFDPVSKKHKLLSFSNGENYVFTLGDNKWRKILHNNDDSSSSSNNFTVQDAQCIHGIIYYLARNDDDELVLVRFNVGSESFLEPIHLPVGLFRFPHDYNYFSSGIYVYRGMILLLNYDYMRKNGFQMWVLEKHKCWSRKRFIPWQPPSPEIHYSVGFIDGEELLFYSSELDAANSDKDFRLYSYDLEKGRSSWMETRFPDLMNKLDGSARYMVGFYYYVNTLEPLKPLSIEQEQHNFIS